MPIYEYRCVCGNEQEEMRPVTDRDKSPVCAVCGREMQRKWSVPSPCVMKPTGRGMALDSLNSKDTAHMKPSAKLKAAQGLDNPPKTFY